jgi:hypothetical protein
VNDIQFQIFGIVHGSVGAALLALLVLSAWLDRRGESESFGSGLAIASVLQVVQAAGGLLLHGHYEANVRRLLFVRAPALAWWVERKEHIAVGAVVLTWCAFSSHRAACRAAKDSRQAYGRAASLAARSAALLSLMTFTIGVVAAAGMLGVVK